MKARPGPPAEIHWALPGARLLADEEIRAAVGAALAFGGRAELLVSVVFVTDVALARMHARYLGDPSPTDVMAFELGQEGRGAAGELYVSVQRARREARVRDVPPERELALYVVHGCLHLCGYDDRRPQARKRMRAAERAVLRSLGYA